MILFKSLINLFKNTLSLSIKISNKIILFSKNNSMIKFEIKYQRNIFLDRIWKLIYLNVLLYKKDSFWINKLYFEIIKYDQ